MTRSRSYLLGIFLCALVCGVIWAVFAGHNRQEQRAAAEVVARAPHVSDTGLSVAFAKNAKAAARRFGGRMIVVTGTVGGEDEGLIGDGCIYMGANIVFDVGGHFGPAVVTRPATVIGRCDGLDQYGVISLSSARVLGTVVSQQ